MMGINEVSLRVLLLWISAIITKVRSTSIGWISGNQTVTQYDSNVTLTCYSDHSLPAEWWFSHNKSRAVPIYLDRIIQPRWQGVYDITVGSNFYNLSIVSVSFDNDGRYECREGSGVRNTKWHSSYLHVNDFDECVTRKDICSQFANCSNTFGSFTCECQAGYSGSGFSYDGCIDVDECLLEENGGCGEHAKCWNTEGSFRCQCDRGFTRSGSHCFDIDECLQSPCDVNAICFNTIGSFACHCNVEFAGLGLKDTCHELKQLPRYYVHKLVNDEGLLTCQTNDDSSVIWLFRSTANTSQVHLYPNGKFVQDTGPKVSAVGRIGQCGKCGNYDIKLHDMQISYSGWYVCIENEGRGKAHGIYVNVTGLDGLTYETVNASVGERKTLGCETDIPSSVVWFYAENFTAPRKYLFENGSVTPDTQSEFWYVIKPIGWKYDITLIGTQRGQSGLYVCIENSGIGKIRRSYQLIVMEPEPLEKSTVVVLAVFTVADVVYVCLCVACCIRDGLGKVCDAFLLGISVVYVAASVIAFVLLSLLILKHAEVYSVAGILLGNVFLVLLVVMTKMAYSRYVDWKKEKGKFADSRTKDQEPPKRQLITNPIFLGRSPKCLADDSRESSTGNVGGLTIFKDELFIVRRQPTNGRIEVYRLRTGKFKHYVEINGLGDISHGLISCTAWGKECLYVSDWSNNKIHIVQLPYGRDDVIQCWSLTEKPFGLCIDSDGKLLVACGTKLVQLEDDGSTLHEYYLKA